MKTLFVLESGLTKASEVAKEFFAENKEFFVSQEKDSSLVFTNLDNTKEMRTSELKDLNTNEHGYIRAETQNSIINLWRLCGNKNTRLVACFNTNDEYEVPQVMTHSELCVRKIHNEHFTRTICVDDVFFQVRKYLINIGWQYCGIKKYSYAPEWNKIYFTAKNNEHTVEFAVHVRDDNKFEAPQIGISWFDETNEYCEYMTTHGRCREAIKDCIDYYTQTIREQ